MHFKTFYIILFVLIFFGVFKSFKTPVFDVKGKAVMLTGIQNPMYENASKIIPISGAKILVAKGKVLAQPQKQFIQINQIKSPKLFALTNDEGIFKFKLEKGEYTFFIIFENQAYLNSFDGKGHFSSEKIESNISDLVITDKRGVLY